MLAVMFCVLFVMGMFMDAFAIMMLTIPVFFPIAEALGFDLVWFGIIVLMSLEMSLTTPPFGLLLFIMLGMAPRGTTLAQVSLSAVPYLTCDLILVIILTVYPQVALYLPSFVR